MTPSTWFKLTSLILLLVAGSAFADDQRADQAHTEVPVASAPFSDDAEEAGATEGPSDCAAETAASDESTLDFLESSQPVFMSGGLHCEGWSYAGCCSSSTKRYKRPCFDSQGNKTWQYKCEGHCPL